MMDKEMRHTEKGGGLGAWGRVAELVSFGKLVSTAMSLVAAPHAMCSQLLAEGNTGSHNTFLIQFLCKEHFAKNDPK